MTHSTANFRGLVATIGNRAKQMTKHAAAPTLRAPKTSSRSHLLTKAHRIRQRESTDSQHVPKVDQSANGCVHCTNVCEDNVQCREPQLYPKRLSQLGHETCPDCGKSLGLDRGDSRANQPSSSSLRLGAGNGAPGPSLVGRLT